MVCFTLSVLCIYHQIPRTRVLYEIDFHIGFRIGAHTGAHFTSRLNVRHGAEQISFASLAREWLSLSSPFPCSLPLRCMCQLLFFSFFNPPLSVLFQFTYFLFSTCLFSQLKKKKIFFFLSLKPNKQNRKF